MSARDNILKHYGAGSPTLAYLLDRYRAEVLTEAARLLEDTGRDDDAVNLLDNLASHETPGQDNAPAPENTPLSPEREAERVQGLIYEAITAFQQTAHLSSLQHAQMRGYLAEHLAPVVAAEVDRVRADRDAFCDRVDTLTAVAQSNKRYVQEMFAELQTVRRERSEARARVAELEQRVNELVQQRDDALADLVAEGAAGVEPDNTPDPLVYGPTGYRCGCGKDAHSNLTPCQPMTAQEWNDHYPVGTRVAAFPITRDEEPLLTRTRSKAWEFGHGAAVVSVEGYTGGIALTHIDVIEGGESR